MFFHNIEGAIAFSSSVNLGNTADHLNWLAKGSNNKEASALYSQARNPYPLLNRSQHTVNRTA